MLRCIGLQTHYRYIAIVICLLGMYGFFGQQVFAFDYQDGDIVHGEYLCDLISPLEIPDDAYDGSLGSPSTASDTINLNWLDHQIAPGHTVDDLSVTLWMSSSFIGDLTIKLEHDDTIVTMLNRPGIVGIPDDGSVPGGSSANLSFLYPITFTDHELDYAAELMGSTITTSDFVGDPANGSSDTYFPYGDDVEPDTLSTFIGGSAYGDWTLHIGDSSPNAGDVPAAELQKWSISLDRVVPEPSSFLLLCGISGLLFRRNTR